MDHIKVLKRALELTWRYRVLWVFGIILALTSGGGGGSGGPQSRFDGDLLSRDLSLGKVPLGDVLPIPVVPEAVVGTLIAVGIGLACFILLLIVVSVVAHYVAETALIRLVDDYEGSGERRSVRQGFRMGWSRSALRLFLINLLIVLPTILAFIVLALIVAAPVLLLGDTPAKVIGIVGTIGLAFLFILLLIVVIVVLTLLMRFFWRACALEGLGVFESIRRGYCVVRGNLKDVAVMWLLMAGVGIGITIAMIIIVLFLLALGLVVGGLPALLVGGLASQAFEGAVPWILGAAAGVPIFLLVMVLPLLLVGGLIEVFKSSVWTLTYRELLALESVEPEADQPPELEAAEPA
jgi:hypothetical protein